MTFAAKMQVQRRPFAGSNACKVHAKAKNMPNKTTPIRPADKPDLIKRLGTAVGAIALAATLSFGGQFQPHFTPLAALD